MSSVRRLITPFIMATLYGVYLMGIQAEASSSTVNYCVEFLQRSCQSHTDCRGVDFCDSPNLCNCEPVIANGSDKKSDIPDYVSKTHECGYYDCKLPKLEFRTLKIFSKCTYCFPGLEVHRVFEEFHGYDYGIEFSFRFGQHLQDYGDDDWTVFQRRNITSNLSGIFRIIRDGDDKQYIQWSRLKVVS